MSFALSPRTDVGLARPIFCRRKAKMSALSKVGMSVFSLLVVRLGGCGSDECGADEQARAESDRCTGAARWPSADGPGGGRSDAGHPAADPSVVEAIPRWQCACDCEPAAWSAIEQPLI